MFDDFFIRALVAGLGVALVTGPLGCFIIWRRLSFFGDTLAHSALLGVTLAFSFDINNYQLGEQTVNKIESQLANSGKGQHIHFIVNNGPYSAHYTNNFKKKLNSDNNVILAFLSRSYHESVKNPNAFILTQIGKSKIDLDNEFLFYSRPKGTYKGKDTEKLLLDFYLVNTTISSNGNKVKATINDTEFIITEWSPYYLEGLKKGEVKIKLELINSEGKLIDSPFNPSIRTVNLE